MSECGATRNGMVCTLAADHSGDHQALGIHDQALLTWARPLPTGPGAAPVARRTSRTLEDMRRASAQVDEAEGTSGYQIGMMALALIARQYLRELDRGAL